MSPGADPGAIGVGKGGLPRSSYTNEPPANFIPAVAQITFCQIVGNIRQPIRVVADEGTASARLALIKE